MRLKRNYTVGCHVFTGNRQRNSIFGPLPFTGFPGACIHPSNRDTRHPINSRNVHNAHSISILMDLLFLLLFFFLPFSIFPCLIRDPRMRSWESLCQWIVMGLSLYELAKPSQIRKIYFIRWTLFGKRAVLFLVVKKLSL